MTTFSFAALAWALSLPPVVGGRPVAAGGRPEALALVSPTGEGERYELTCTAALIAPRVALTAAHCLDGLDANGVRTLRIATGKGVEGGVLGGPFTAVERAATHPRFRAHPLGQADVALLFLAATPAGAAPVPFAQTLSEFRQTIGAGKSLTIVGYGRREDSGRGLKYEADVALASFTSHEALTAEGGRDACAGDSGGPALAVGPSGAPLLAGIVARGRTLECGRGGYLSLTSDASCWIAREAALPPAPECQGEAPRYSPKALAALRVESLCASSHANPTQRETLAALALALGAPDCAALAGKLAQATTLDLDFLMLRDLSPLAHLPQLASLSLRGNRVTDVAPLATLPALTFVALDGNDVADLAPLAGVEIHGSRRQLGTFTDTAFLRACRDEALPEAARATVRAVFWKTQTEDCALANQRLLGLTTLALDERNLVDLSPLAELPAVRRLSLAANAALTDVAPLAGMEDLRVLDLMGTGVTDLAPLAPLVAKGLVITGP